MPSPTDQTVVVYRANDPAYPERAPFHPSRAFPRIRLGGTRHGAQPRLRGRPRPLDGSGVGRGPAQGTADWNPLRDLMRPGDTVLLKPNMVHERHPREADGWRYVLTHGSVIRAVADYVWKAVGPGGRIILADAPQTDASFTTMVELLGLDAIRAFYETTRAALRSHRSSPRRVDDARRRRRQPEAAAGEPLRRHRVRPWAGQRIRRARR